MPFDLKGRARYSQADAQVVLRAQRIRVRNCVLGPLTAFSVPFIELFLTSAAMSDWKLGVTSKGIKQWSVCKGADVKQKSNKVAPMFLMVREGASDPPSCFPSLEAPATPPALAPLK